MNRFRSHTSLTQLADKVAECCFESAWQRVDPRLVTMSANESRGYIRARGASLITRHVEAVATRNELAADRTPQLYALAVESLISRVQSHARELTRRKFVRRAA